MYSSELSLEGRYQIFTRVYNSELSPENRYQIFSSHAKLKIIMRKVEIKHSCVRISQNCHQKADVRHLLLCKIQSYQEKSGNQTLNFDIQELK